MYLSTIRTLLRAARIPFLVLTPLCIWLSVVLTLNYGVELDAIRLFCVIVGGLLVHISVNSFNEYFDFRSGLDLLTKRTPFSGGSGALPEQPDSAPAVLALAISTLLGAALIGCYLALQAGPLILLIGAAGAFIALAYASWLNTHPLACLLAPGLGFGPLMVLGAVLALGGPINGSAWIASGLVALLVSNLLLVNQFPDRQADARAGRRHLLVEYGPEFSAGVSVLLVVLAAVTTLLAAATGKISMPVLVILGPLAAMLYAAKKLPLVADNNLPRLLTINLVATLLALAGLAGGLHFYKF